MKLVYLLFFVGFALVSASEDGEIMEEIDMVGEELETFADGGGIQDLQDLRDRVRQCLVEYRGCNYGPRPSRGPRPSGRPIPSRGPRPSGRPRPMHRFHCIREFIGCIVFGDK